MAIPKNKTQITIDDYTGFRWNGKHTSQLGLTAISSSSRYSLNPISSITNNTIDVPGGDGQYYFNSTYGPKKWTVNFAFDNLDDYQWRDLLNWLYHKETSDLVFDELPYKAYSAKLEGTPVVNYLCFEETRAKYNDISIDKDTYQTVNWSEIDTIAPLPPSYIIETEVGNNFDRMYYKKRIYKGEGTLNFIAPFPYAFSARNYDGKYMKYLSELEYYSPVDFKDIQNNPMKMEIGHSIISIDGSPVSNNTEKRILYLQSIEGSSVFQDGKIINTTIGNDKENSLTLFYSDLTENNKIFFNTINGENTENQIYFANFNNDWFKDMIVYNEDIKKYELIKKIGSCKPIEGTTYREDKNTITVSLKKLIGEEHYNKINLTDKVITDKSQIPDGLFQFDYFKFFSQKPADDNIEEPIVYIKNGIRFDRNNNVREITLTFIAPQSQLNLLEEFKRYLDGQNSNYNMNIYYPQKEEHIELIVSQEGRLILHSMGWPKISMVNYNEELNNNETFTYLTTFYNNAVLYNNIDEWRDSSGLKESQIDDKDGKYYDKCLTFEDNSTYGFKVYNGGDLPTPFKIKIPVVNKSLIFNNKEITFALVQRENENVDSEYNKPIQITNIADLQKGIVYGNKTDEDIEYKYYFQEIDNFSTPSASFLTADGDYVSFKIDQNSTIYRKPKQQEAINTLNYFTIRINNTDAEESYAQLIKDYITAAQKTENDINNFKNFLEIDTFKQTINFIVESTITNQKIIIPIYFVLRRGELFFIPPKIDNLAILVYNLREKENPFITTDNNKIGDIDYRYLYL